MSDVALHAQPEVHQRRWFLLGVLCLSLVMVVMAVSSLNVALPTLQSQLGASATMIQWIVDSYALVFAGLLLTAGALGDRFGRKRALLFGLALFGAGGIISGLAGSADIVIVGRAVQGAGAAFVMPATLSLITAIFPPEERQRAIAIWVGFAGAGGAIGPIVSGALLERFWWGSAFLINVPVVAVTAVAVAIYSPNSRDEAATPLDPRGALLSLFGLGTLLFAIIEGPERGWTDPFVVGSFLAAALLLTAFVRWEQVAPHPMLPLTFFSDRRFSVGSAVITTAFFLMFGWFFLFSLYLQFARGDSPLEAGLATLPFAAVLVLVSPRSAAIGERLGGGLTIAAGFALIALGMAVFTVIGVSTPYLVLVGAMVLMAAGMAVTAAPATGAIMSAVPLAKAGVGSAVNDTTREVGGALGIAIFGTIVNSAYRSRVDLSGLGLSGSAADQAKDSVGSAVGVAARVGGDSGAGLAHRAASAFADAYNVAATVSVVIAVAAAFLVARTFSRAKEQAAASGSLPELDAVAVGTAPIPAPD
ncbi:MAG TPA: MFS transporter [Acidimicrobiales bacterium]|nr:MFS transporter [Acidimicrobiales bacterium]